VKCIFGCAIARAKITMLVHLIAVGCLRFLFGVTVSVLREFVAWPPRGDVLLINHYFVLHFIIWLFVLRFFDDLVTGRARIQLRSAQRTPNPPSLRHG